VEEEEVLARLAPAGRREAGARARGVPESLLGYRGLIVERVEEPAPRQRRARAARERRGLFAADSVPWRAWRAGLCAPGRTAAPTYDPFIEDFVCGSTGPIRLTGLGRDFSDRFARTTAVSRSRRAHDMARYQVAAQSEVRLRTAT
jgi:hypothetical protein